MRKTSLQTVYEMAKTDPRIVFIGSDLGPGTLDEFRDEMPDRFFMEGVSEQHIIGMAAGLAMEGFIPYVNTIATFLTRRCFEQIVCDVCLHNLPVRLIASGGGTVYAPLGPTHLAVEDIAILRTLPNMTVVAPCDADEMTRLIEASTAWPQPMYIRLAKGGEKVISGPDVDFEIGKAILMREPGSVLFVSTGAMTQKALEAAELLAPTTRCGVLHMHTIKPLDQDAIIHWSNKVDLMVTIEEHTRIGGLGSAVAETFVDHLTAPPRLIRLGLPDAFAKEYGSQESMLESNHLTGADIAASVHTRLKMCA